MEMLNKAFWPKDVMARAEQKHTVGEFKLKSEEDIDSYSVFIAFLKLKY